jgi:hypothetical protein
MRYLTWTTHNTRYLVPVGVAACMALLAFDLFVFWVLDLRPLASSLEATTLVWSLLVGACATYAARWALGREQRVRYALAATVASMVLMSAMHPWLNGHARDGATPFAPTIAQPDPRPQATVFSGAPLTEADAGQY